MRTASKTLSHAWVGAGLSAGTSRVIGRSVDGLTVIYGPGKDPVNFIGAANALPPDMEIGTATVMFSGVNADSEIRVFSGTGIALAGVESCVVDQTLTWNVYGAAFNNAVVRIIHPLYKIIEFHYSATAGDQSIPVQQEPDKWYFNPA